MKKISRAHTYLLYCHSKRNSLPLDVFTTVLPLVSVPAQGIAPARARCARVAAGVLARCAACTSLTQFCNMVLVLGKSHTILQHMVLVLGKSPMTTLPLHTVRHVGMQNHRLKWAINLLSLSDVKTKYLLRSQEIFIRVNLEVLEHTFIIYDYTYTKANNARCPYKYLRSKIDTILVFLQV